ncbi:hypothetical protein EXIGLDRAFT_837168 [Exidia glandulosa HHB12029]|uniref:CN hydrolase domain-containing protein n=1 Tax=Exidia glandulosa HHB12029 TaxID=1314781 RepID=A0A165H1Z3_EXIGL|nr:hypothetical protein EXIGLDRAFT_837168 [Exidia glandulosa HHB12029]
MEHPRESKIIRTLAQRPRWAVFTASAALGYLALQTTLSLAPLVGLLALLFTAAHDVRAKQPNAAAPAVLWACITLGATIARISPSLTALSTPLGAVVLSAVMSGVSVAAAMLLVNVAVWSHGLYGWAGLCTFPTIWTGLGWLESTTPLGRLLSWTPLKGSGMYEWIMPYIGPSALDWITAAWAVVFAELILYTSPVEELEDLEPYADDPNVGAPIEEAEIPRRHVPKLAVLLVALAIPSLIVNPFHQSTPPAERNSTRLPVDPLDRYIDESKNFTSNGRLLLWPEGAVTVHSAEQRIAMFQKINDTLTGRQQRTWIAVSYIEPSRAQGKQRNAVTVFGSKGELFTYYKRNLVPLVESYSQITEDKPPEVHQLPLDVNPPGKNRGSHDIHGVALSAGICLDFASSFPALSQKPALILAPANTWHAEIGEAMAAHARLRARELATHVLWCDGGAGGRSALFGPEGDVVYQVGGGSWLATLDMPYPFEERRSAYGVLGSTIPVGLMCLLLPFLPLLAGAAISVTAPMGK